MSGLVDWDPDYDYEIIKSNFESLKGKRIKMEYNDCILLDKVDPSFEEIISTLYLGDGQ